MAVGFSGKQLLISRQQAWDRSYTDTIHRDLAVLAAGTALRFCSLVPASQPAGWDCPHFVHLAFEHCLPSLFTDLLLLSNHWK